LLQAEQDLGNHQGSQPGEADLTATADRSCRASPPAFGETGVVMLVGTQALLVRLAVRAAVISAFARARNDKTRLIPVHGLGRRRHQGSQPVDIGAIQSEFAQAATARDADPVPRCRCRRAPGRPADRTAQQRMIGRRAQHLPSGVPARINEERHIDALRPHGGLGIDNALAEDVLTPHRRANSGADRGRAHRSASASSRGLGTRSTAVRSRPGSGCR